MYIVHKQHLKTISACTEVNGAPPGREFCHIFDNIQKTVADAESTCQGLGYDLLTINSDAESAEFAINLPINRYTCVRDLYVYNIILY